eukprot:g33460.t2
MDPAEAPELHDSQASLLNWFCEWALVPLADALGISQHDVLCAAEILRDPAVSALLRSCQRGLDIVFARYAAASPAPREPYRRPGARSFGTSGTPEPFGDNEKTRED